MPTADREIFVGQTLKYFDRQTYPHRELIVVDDGARALESLPARPDIRCLRLEGRHSIGAKRNLACEMAHGSIIAQWDDDDWYGPGRLSRQVAPILRDEADITGLVASLFFDLDRWQLWRLEPWLHRQLFVGDVAGGTLVYKRHVWERLSRYPDTSLAEDADLLRGAMARGARLERIDQNRLFIYLRHGRNSWRFQCGQHAAPAGWQRMRKLSMPTADAAFYRRLHKDPDEAPRPIGQRKGNAPTPLRRRRPLVSCLMPTADRPAFVPQAIRYFERSAYPELELVVADSGHASVADLVPDSPRIRYLRLDSDLSLGEIRNIACEEACGDLLLHWDDDDWFAPWRISYQVQDLRRARAQIAGVTELRFYDPHRDSAWHYRHPGGPETWLAGTSLLYTREYWRQQPFPALDIGEDNHFTWRARSEQAVAHPRSDFVVALVHPGNTSLKRVTAACYQEIAVDDVHRLVGVDQAFYSRLTAAH